MSGADSKPFDGGAIVNCDLEVYIYIYMNPEEGREKLKLVDYHY